MRRALLLVVLLLAGCSGGGGGEETSGPTSVTDPGSTDGQTTVSGGSGSSPPAQRVRVERPSGTPLGEVIPAGDDAYLLLSTGRCAELLARTGTWRDGDNEVNEDAFLLYKAAAEACLGRWADAQRDFQRLQGIGPDFSGGCNSNNCERCMGAVLEWLTQVLAIHQQETREVEHVRGTKASPCPAPGRGRPDDQQTTTSTEEETTTSERSSSTTSTTEP